MPAKENRTIRYPAVAGQFYSGDTKELLSEIDEYLENAKLPKVSGELIALISPHAGYDYSGWVSAYAYKSLVGKKVDTAILVGFSHRYPLSGAAVFTSGTFETPLGAVEVDNEIAELIVKNSSVVIADTAAHKYEHSLEVQLPFLQRVAEQSKIVPILINDADTDTCTKLADAIVAAIRNAPKAFGVILIASTDLTHYPEYRYAVEVDREAINAMVELDVDKLDAVSDKWLGKGIPNLHCVLCSDAAVKSVIIASKNLGANQATLLKYANSGDVRIGNKHQVVGYAAIAIVKQ